MDNRIQYLKWDSDFFEKKIGRIDVDYYTDLNTLLNDAKKAGYQLIYIFGGQDLYIDDEVLRKFNGLFADRKILYEKDIGSTNMALPLVSEYTNKELVSELEQLAFESGKYSRFKLDKNFKENDFFKMYNIWVANSINHQIADKVFIVMENNQIKGMVTLKINEDYGQIGLIAISPNSQGKGYGRALIAACENELFNKHISKLEVSTQLKNKQASLFYEKCGFTIKTITNIYHFWI